MTGGLAVRHREQAERFEPADQEESVMATDGRCLNRFVVFAWRDDAAMLEFRHDVAMDHCAGP